MGHLWLAPPQGGPPSLQLGGDQASNCYVMRARGDLIEILDNARVFAFRIDSPSARFQRRKFFALPSEEMVEEWIKLCLTPPRRS
eukprot:g28334.t1